MTAGNRFTEGSIPKGLVLFAIPILLSNLFQQFYNSVDAAVVGRFAGADALAAVGSTGSLINLLIGFFLGIATGTGVLYAMHYGAGDHPGLKKLIDSALVLGLIASAFITVVGVGACKPLLRWMKTPEEVLPLSATYLRIIFGGCTFNILYNIGAGMIRAEGDSARPLVYLLVSGVSNLALDLLLVAGFGMGVEGAAIATIAAQAISAGLVLFRLTRLDPAYRLRPLHLRPDRVVGWDIVRVAVPCGLQSSMFSISNLLVQVNINAFGKVAMAGVAAYTRIDGFCWMPLGALSLTVSTFVGQNIGAGRYDRVRKGVRFCLLLALAVVGGIALAIIVFIQPLLALFTDDPAAQAVGREMMWYLSPVVWVYIFSDILGGAIRGAGHAGKVTAITAGCICVFRVVWLSVLIPIFPDLRVVFLCYPTSWCLSSLVMILYYFRGKAFRDTLRGRHPSLGA